MGLRVWGLEDPQGSRFRVEGLGLEFGVWGLVFGVWCLVFGVWCLVFVV